MCKVPDLITVFPEENPGRSERGFQAPDFSLSGKCISLIISTHSNC